MKRKTLLTILESNSNPNNDSKLVTEFNDVNMLYSMLWKTPKKGKIALN